MTDPKAPPPPPVFTTGPASASGGRGLGWFFAISGGVLLFLTLGCVFAVTFGNRDLELFGLALLFGSPTLALGGLFLWLGRRRLKR
jgi:hypothetical protein